MAGSQVDAVCSWVGWGTASSCQPLLVEEPGRVTDSNLPGAREAPSSRCQSCLEREKAGVRNSLFLGVGAKAVAPWPDC